MSLLSMAPALNKLPLRAVSILLFCTPVYADVSYVGYYIALVTVLIVLFLPTLIISMSHRTRKRLYLSVQILWAVPAFAYLWVTGARQTEFFIISSLPFILLVIYFAREKKLAQSKK
jgi:hypothetical protein